MTLHGLKAAAEAEIDNVPKIQAFGERSLYNAAITSGGDQESFVLLYGHEAGYGAVITCSAGTTCTLHCYATGCRETTFICQAGATCSVFAGYDNLQECKADGSVPVASDSTVCPFFIMDLSTIASSVEDVQSLNNAKIVNVFGETVIGMKSEFVVYRAAVIGILLSVIAAIYYYQSLADKYSKYMPLPDDSI